MYKENVSGKSFTIFVRFKNVLPGDGGETGRGSMTKTYSEPSQTFKKELFVNIVNG